MGKTEKQYPLCYQDQEVVDFLLLGERQDNDLFGDITEEGNPPHIKQIIYKEIENHPKIYVRLKQDDCIGIRNLLIEIFFDIDIRIRGEKLEEVEKELKNTYTKIVKTICSEGYSVDTRESVDGHLFPNVIVYERKDPLDEIIKPYTCFRCSSTKEKKGETNG
jgi:hypothetical protein